MIKKQYAICPEHGNIGRYGNITKEERDNEALVFYINIDGETIRYCGKCFHNFLKRNVNQVEIVSGG